MSDVTQQLAKLSPAVRETVLLFQSCYEQGKPYRYSDIKKMRLEQGMAAGSLTTIQEAREQWHKIYNIVSDNYDSTKHLEGLVKRTIETLRDTVKVKYEQEADMRNAAAEEAAETMGRECAEIELKLQECEARLQVSLEESEKLKSIQTETHLQRDGLQRENQQLSVELGKLTLTLTGKDELLKKYQDDLKQREAAYQALHTDMEAQRQSQLKLIDDARQEVKHVDKKNTALQSALDKSRSQLHDSKSQLVVSNEKLALSSADLALANKSIKRINVDSKKQLSQLEKQNAQLQNSAAKLEGQLELAKENQHTLNQDLLVQMKAMQNKVVKSKKKVKSS
jgi:chromosome segregation ATPase